MLPQEVAPWPEGWAGPSPHPLPHFRFRNTCRGPGAEAPTTDWPGRRWGGLWVAQHPGCSLMMARSHRPGFVWDPRGAKRINGPLFSGRGREGKHGLATVFL